MGVNLGCSRLGFACPCINLLPACLYMRAGALAPPEQVPGYRVSTASKAHTYFYTVLRSVETCTGICTGFHFLTFASLNSTSYTTLRLVVLGRPRCSNSRAGYAPFMPCAGRTLRGCVPDAVSAPRIAYMYVCLSVPSVTPYSYLYLPCLLQGTPW